MAHPKQHFAASLYSIYMDFPVIFFKKITPNNTWRSIYFPWIWISGRFKKKKLTLNNPWLPAYFPWEWISEWFSWPAGRSVAAREAIGETLAEPAADHILHHWMIILYMMILDCFKIMLNLIVFWMIWNKAIGETLAEPAADHILHWKQSRIVPDNFVCSLSCSMIMLNWISFG